jgi:O-antigen ligase
VLERALTVALPAVPLVALAWASGGYFPETWGAVLLVEAIALVAYAIVAPQIHATRHGVLLGGALLALAAWQAISRSWSVTPDGAVLEAERTLIYAGAAASLLLLVPRRRLDDLVVGVLVGAGAVTIGGLVEYLLRGERGTRLDAPIGYANASGIVAATALLLGLGLATEGLRWRRVLGALMVPPAGAALYLTLSRGALAAGVLGLAVLMASSFPRVRLRASAAALVLGATAVLAVAVHEVRDVRSTPAAQQGAPERLLSSSTSYRADYWDVAAGMVADEPLTGAGAGSFGRVWERERPTLLYVRDAHNLYLETLAEVGPVGLAILLVALGLPLVGARHAVRRPAGRAALAGYAALLAHAAVDWDWELPVVTLCTVMLGVALLRAGEPEAPSPCGSAVRAALVAAAVALGAFAFVVHVGNGAVVEARETLDRGDAVAARREANRARRFAPWAAEPWRLLGEAEAAAGRPALAEKHIHRALSEDPDDWESWLALAFATSGQQRADAVARARALNPLAPELSVFDESDP